MVIDTLGDTLTTPNAEFDQVLYINTHMVPWTDLRAEYTHLNILFPTKLIEYEAVESTGLNVWRHDRNLLDCRLLISRTKLADHNLAMSFALNVAQRPSFAIAQWHIWWPISRSLARVRPPRSVHQAGGGSYHRASEVRPPLSHHQGQPDTKIYTLYRQGLHAMLNYGRYTLFERDTEETTVLVWTKQDVRKGEMERRVERLLNSLFDQHNKVMEGFLCQPLRQCLQLQDSWCMGTIYALKKQFGEEFGLDTSKVEADRVFECEWVRGTWRRPFISPLAGDCTAGSGELSTAVG